MEHATDSLKVLKAFLFCQKCLLLLFTLLLCISHAKAASFDVFKEPCLFVSLAEGGIDAYPLATIEGDYYFEGDSACIRLHSGKTARYHTDDYTSIDTEIPTLPYLTSYKFNNKYNPNLNQDVGGIITNNIIDIKLSYQTLLYFKNIIFIIYHITTTTKVHFYIYCKSITWSHYSIGNFFCATHIIKT